MGCQLQRPLCRRVALGLFAIVLGLEGCGSAPTGAKSTPQGDVLAIATETGTPQGYLGGQLTGTVRGTINADRTACFRLDESPGIPLFWPKGYYARTNPLRVLDAQGNTVAVNGQHVEWAGGTFGFDNRQIVLGCGEVDRVIVVNPR